MEYNVVQTKIEGSRKKTFIVVKVVLKRVPTYFIFNTFVPTLCLFIMTQVAVVRTIQSSAVPAMRKSLKLVVFVSLSSLVNQKNCPLLQATVYFKPEHFKTSIPVVVTAMLVMYTLYQVTITR